MIRTFGVIISGIFFSFWLAGCAPNTIKGTEKQYDITIHIHDNTGAVTLTSPLRVESVSETTQDANPSTVISPETALAMPSGGSTASIAAQAANQSLKDIASKLVNDLSKKNSENPVTNNPATPAVTPAADTQDVVADTPADEVPVVDGAIGPTKAILWKPIADSGGMLVVLLPKDMGNPTVSVCDMAGAVIETGDFVYYSNPDRATYRFDKPGASYPQPCLLKVGDVYYLIKRPSLRAEVLPSYTIK